MMGTWEDLGFKGVDMNSHDGFARYDIKVFEYQAVSTWYIVEVDEESEEFVRATIIDEQLQEAITRLHLTLRDRITEWHIGEVWIALASGILLSDSMSMETAEWLEEGEARRVMREEVGFDPYPSPEDLAGTWRDLD